MLRRFALLFLFLTLVGCGGSDRTAAPANNNASATNSSSSNSTAASSASTDTSKVPQKDLDTARKKYHLRGDLQIDPKGYAFHQQIADISGTYFKFIAKTDKIEKVFAPDLDLSKFHSHALLTPNPRDAWWDVDNREFNGGNVKLPDGGEISVGYVDNKDGTLTVYIEM